MTSFIPSLLKYTLKKPHLQWVEDSKHVCEDERLFVRDWQETKRPGEAQNRK